MTRRTLFLAALLAGRAAALGALIAVLAVPVVAQQTLPGPLTDGVHFPSVRLGLDGGRAPQVGLDPLDLARVLAEDERRRADGGSQRAAVGRPLALSAGDGGWLELADGRALWVVEVTSPAALALRLRFEGVALPAGGEMAVGAATTAGRLTTPVRTYAPGSERRGGLWSQVVDGESARIEYLAPAGAPRSLPFQLASLYHVYARPAAWRKAECGDGCNAPGETGLFSLLVPDSGDLVHQLMAQLADRPGTGNGTFMTAPISEEQAQRSSWEYFHDANGGPRVRGEGLRRLFEDPKRRFVLVEPMQTDLQPAGISWLELAKKLPATGTLLYSMPDAGNPAVAVVTGVEARLVTGGCPAGQKRIEPIDGEATRAGGLFGPSTGDVAAILFARTACVSPVGDVARNPLLVKGPSDGLDPRRDSCSRRGVRLHDGDNGPFRISGSTTGGKRTHWFHVIPDGEAITTVRVVDGDGRPFTPDVFNKLQLAIYKRCPPSPAADVAVFAPVEGGVDDEVEISNDDASSVYCVGVSRGVGWSRLFRLVVNEDLD